jgi:hypothetical protein
LSARILAILAAPALQGRNSTRRLHHGGRPWGLVANHGRVMAAGLIAL